MYWTFKMFDCMYVQYITSSDYLKLINIQFLKTRLNQEDHWSRQCFFEPALEGICSLFPAIWMSVLIYTLGAHRQLLGQGCRWQVGRGEWEWLHRGGGIFLPDRERQSQKRNRKTKGGTKLWKSQNMWGIASSSDVERIESGQMSEDSKWPKMTEVSFLGSVRDEEARKIDWGKTEQSLEWHKYLVWFIDSLTQHVIF